MLDGLLLMLTLVALSVYVVVLGICYLGYKAVRKLKEMPATAQLVPLADGAGSAQNSTPMTALKNAAIKQGVSYGVKKLLEIVLKRR